MTKVRLDIFDFEENKPVLAFRPYASQPEYRQDVTWAALVANNMLITLNEDGYLIAWDLPSCKPKWSMEIVKLLVPGLDASRTTLAVGSLDGVHIVDVATGEVRGSLERVLERPRVRLRELVFRGDGEALVSRYVEISENLRTSKTTICSWDLMDGSLKREIQLNCESNSIGWVGPDQVLLRRTSSGDRSTNITRQDFSKFYQCSLVDLKRGFLTWTYQHPHGKTIDQAFVDRHWCIVSSSISQAGHLMAITLPDPEAAKLLETAKPPRALLKKNDQVSLSVEVVGDFPVSSDDQKNRAISLRDEVHKKIIDALAAIRITHNEQAPTRLNVSLSERKLSRKVTVRPRLRPYGTRVLLLTTTYVEISFNLVSSGNTIWRASQHVSINDIESNKLGKAPAGSDSGLFYRRLLWETALKKVANFDLPLPIYSTEVAEGLGESNLSPSGGKATRKPRVSQDKQT